MIKICKYLYIHWLFLLLLVFCYINRQLELLFVSYFIMLIHELAHLFAAKKLGLTSSYVVIYPFGVNLRLKNTILYSLTDEIIFYISGPFANVLMALATLPFLDESIFIYDFYIKNVALFFINLLPLVPLDGGMIFKKILLYKLGFDGATLVSRIFSVLTLILVTAILGYIIYTNKFNPYFCIFAAFILGNVFVSREKYNLTLIKELVYCRQKHSKKKPYKAKIIGASDSTALLDIAKKFNMSSNYFVVYTDNKSKVKCIETEEEIIDALISEKSV